MLNAKDLELLAAKGISEKQIEEQLACFVKGFPFLEITASASVERGIMVIPQEKQAPYMDAWDAYLAKNKKILKFVPASGAASRMFKNLYELPERLHSGGRGESDRLSGMRQLGGSDVSLQRLSGRDRLCGAGI